MSAAVRWTGDDRIRENMARYGAAAKQAVWQIAQYLAPLLETYAKQNAPWVDRTGNARQSLYAVAYQMANEAVAVRLSHGVQYGLWLEILNAGVWGIIWEALQSHMPRVRQMLREVFG